MMWNYYISSVISFEYWLSYDNSVKPRKNSGTAIKNVAQVLVCFEASWISINKLIYDIIQNTEYDSSEHAK